MVHAGGKGTGLDGTRDGTPNEVKSDWRRLLRRTDLKASSPPLPRRVPSSSLPPADAEPKFDETKVRGRSIPSTSSQKRAVQWSPSPTHKVQSLYSHSSPSTSQTPDIHSQQTLPLHTSTNHASSIQSFTFSNLCSVSPTTEQISSSSMSDKTVTTKKSTLGRRESSIRVPPSDSTDTSLDSRFSSTHHIPRPNTVSHPTASRVPRSPLASPLLLTPHSSLSSLSPLASQSPLTHPPFTRASPLPLTRSSHASSKPLISAPTAAFKTPFPTKRETPQISSTTTPPSSTVGTTPNTSPIATPQRSSPDPKYAVTGLGARSPVPTAFLHPAMAVRSTRRSSPAIFGTPPTGLMSGVSNDSKEVYGDGLRRGSIRQSSPGVGTPGLGPRGLGTPEFSSGGVGLFGLTNKRRSPFTEVTKGNEKTLLSMDQKAKLRMHEAEGFNTALARRQAVLAKLGDTREFVETCRLLPVGEPLASPRRITNVINNKGDWKSQPVPERFRPIHIATELKLWQDAAIPAADFSNVKEGGLETGDATRNSKSSSQNGETLWRNRLGEVFRTCVMIQKHHHHHHTHHFHFSPTAFRSPKRNDEDCDEDVMGVGGDMSPRSRRWHLDTWKRLINEEGMTPPSDYYLEHAFKRVCLIKQPHPITLETIKSSSAALIHAGALLLLRWVAWWGSLDLCESLLYFRARRDGSLFVGRNQNFLRSILAGSLKLKDVAEQDYNDKLRSIAPHLNLCQLTYIRANLPLASPRPYITSFIAQIEALLAEALCATVLKRSNRSGKAAVFSHSKGIPKVQPLQWETDAKMGPPREIRTNRLASLRTSSVPASGLLQSRSCALQSQSKVVGGATYNPYRLISKLPDDSLPRERKKSILVDDNKRNSIVLREPVRSKLPEAGALGSRAGGQGGLGGASRSSLRSSAPSPEIMWKKSMPPKCASQLEICERKRLSFAPDLPLENDDLVKNRGRRAYGCFTSNGSQITGGESPSRRQLRKLVSQGPGGLMSQYSKLERLNIGRRLLQLMGVIKCTQKSHDTFLDSIRPTDVGRIGNSHEDEVKTAHDSGNAEEKVGKSRKSNTSGRAVQDEIIGTTDKQTWWYIQVEDCLLAPCGKRPKELFVQFPALVAESKRPGDSFVYQARVGPCEIADVHIIDVRQLPADADLKFFRNVAPFTSTLETLTKSKLFSQSHLSESQSALEQTNLCHSDDTPSELVTPNASPPASSYTPSPTVTCNSSPRRATSPRRPPSPPLCDAEDRLSRGVTVEELPDALMITRRAQPGSPRRADRPLHVIPSCSSSSAARSDWPTSSTPESSPAPVSSVSGSGSDLPRRRSLADPSLSSATSFLPESKSMSSGKSMILRTEGLPPMIVRKSLPGSSPRLLRRANSPPPFTRTVQAGNDECKCAPAEVGVRHQQRLGGHHRSASERKPSLFTEKQGLSSSHFSPSQFTSDFSVAFSRSGVFMPTPDHRVDLQPSRMLNYDLTRSERNMPMACVDAPSLVPVRRLPSLRGRISVGERKASTKAETSARVLSGIAVHASHKKSRSTEGEKTGSQLSDTVAKSIKEASPESKVARDSSVASSNREGRRRAVSLKREESIRNEEKETQPVDKGGGSIDGGKVSGQKQKPRTESGGTERRTHILSLDFLQSECAVSPTEFVLANRTPPVGKAPVGRAQTTESGNNLQKRRTSPAPNAPLSKSLPRLKSRPSFERGIYKPLVQGATPVKLTNR